MSKSLSNINVEKFTGRYYTPEFIVKNILDLSEYYDENIVSKHIIDNSCGDGAFLKEIVKRYCTYRLKTNINLSSLKQELETYIHGIEIDKDECNKCIKNLNSIANEYGLSNVKWDIINADALNVDKFNNKMDFVIGNPPYVRIHNISNQIEKIKDFSFAKIGMTDLYIVFYQIGLNMLNKNGTLGYITPNSFFNSIAGSNMRKYIIDNNLLVKVVNLKHFQPFDATTYTTIIVLKNNNSSRKLDYYEFDEKNMIPYYIDTLNYKDCYISNNFFFSQKNNLTLIRKIFENLGHCDIKVKNGYATLCDDVFISNFNFNSNFIIPVIKASKGIAQNIIFPYDKNAKIISETELQKEHQLYEYLIKNKEKLLNRSIEKNDKKNWYAFGRSQALVDTYTNKLTLNTLIKSKDDLKMIEAPTGVGVYGGLYLTTGDYSFDTIKSILKTDEFFNFISLLGKYKSGGFYTYSSKDVKLFLDYKLAYNGGLLYYDQWRITKCPKRFF